MRVKVGLRGVMLAVALSAFAVIITIQGRKIADLEAKVQRLQVQASNANRANVQIANQFIKMSQAFGKDYRELFRSVEELKKQSKPPETGPNE